MIELRCFSAARTTLFLAIAGLCLVFSNSVYAQPSTGQARRLISRMGEMRLPSSAVKVRRVSAGSKTEAIATAEIETALRLAFAGDHWSLREVRTAPDRWEDLSVFGIASKDDCEFPPTRAPEPTVQRARCLIASALRISLPSDSVRIRSVSPFSLPLATEPSALVVAIVQLDFQLSRDRSGWRVTGVRSGGSDFVSVDQLIAQVNERKRQAARDDLIEVAEALEKFRRARGFYVPSKEQRVLIDHLSPRYLSRVIRVDPWHRPYHYEGERQRFTIRSGGPDGEPNTGDDIVVANP